MTDYIDHKSSTFMQNTMLNNWKPYQSDLQREIEDLSIKCRIPSAEDKKYALMIPNGAFLNMPLNKSGKQSKKPKKPLPPKSPQCQNKRSLSQSRFKIARDKIVEKEITSGYIYRRTPDNVQVILTEKFWDKDSTSKKKTVDESENFVHQEVVEKLERTVARLKLQFEEAKLDHNVSIKNSESEQQHLLKKKDEHHKKSIEIIELARQEELDGIKKEHREYVEQIQSENNKGKSKLESEVVFLKRQLELQKEFGQDEMERKMKDKQYELQQKIQETTQQLINKQRMQLENEHTIAIDQLRALNNKHVTSIMETHQQEIDRVLSRFAYATRGAEKLKQVTLQLEVTRKENNALEKELTETRGRCLKTENELADVKIKLSVLEKGFEGKVSKAEEKIFHEVERITLENFELRKKYIKKCEELHEANMIIEAKQNYMLNDTKAFLKSVILNRTHENDGLSTTESTQISDGKPHNRYVRRAVSGVRERPLSSPSIASKGQHWTMAENKRTGRSKSGTDNRQEMCRSALPRIVDHTSDTQNKSTQGLSGTNLQVPK